MTHFQEILTLKQTGC